MTFTPAIREMNVLRQGGEVFTYPAQWNDIIHMAANTEGHIDVTALRTAANLKAGQPLFVIFSSDAPFWANFYNTAAVPTGNVTDGSGPEFSPNQRYIDASVTTISCISAQACNISASFYLP